MTTWLLVWLIIVLTTTVLIAAFTVALVRHGIFVGRSAARLAEEAGALSAEIGQGSDRASRRVAGFSLGDRSEDRR